mmetsp:Transcript_12225/g.30546  ORF Transcript_12225/g.30546 Transcript_12225/m.30546 type:complete len:314 (-) Transcript_12225:2-943(-)
MFKFDGVAGDPAELADEIDAMLKLIGEIRREQGACERDVCTAVPKAKRSVWINLTTGTWPSPWFLLSADSIWRGQRDVLTPGWRGMIGATNRQRWQVFRECVVYHLVAQRAYLFPLSALMIHGVVLGSHGEAGHLGLNQATELDFQQEVWSFVAMGFQLQELYVSPPLMTDWRWDTLAAALRWAASNHELLLDSHWALPATCLEADPELMPHGTAAWNHTHGVIFLRNPRPAQQGTSSFRLQDLLEMDSGEKHSGRLLEIRVAQYLTDEKVQWSCALLKNSAVLDGCCGLEPMAETAVVIPALAVMVLEIRWS